MEFIMNLTPHEVAIYEGGNKTHIFPSQGNARAKQTVEQTGELYGVPMCKISFGEPVDLPEVREGIYYIVSLITANSAKQSGRKTDDLLVTTNPVRNETGQIIGCEYLSRFSET